MLDEPTTSGAGKAPGVATFAGTVCLVTVDSLVTTYARLRPGAPPVRETTKAELPLRVATAGAGRYVVLDG